MKKVFWFVSSCFVLAALPVLAECPSADLTGDCVVNMHDLMVVASQWLQGTVPAEDIQWVFIPTGSFVMGDAFNEGGSSERPIHEVTLTKGFRMSRYEVTNVQYAACLNLYNDYNLIKVVNGVVYAVDDSANAKPWFSTSAAKNESQIEYKNGVFTVRVRDGQPQDRHPVVHVSWYGAQAFCDAYDYKLPTEAQWEYAARGVMLGKRFSWGNENIDHTRVNYWHAAEYGYENSTPYATGTTPYTAPVGSFAPNGYGLFDMTGNVWEWCQDWYGEKYYASSPTNDPQGPASGTNRMIRGSGWGSTAYYCRVACRYNWSPSDTELSIGFRVVRD